MKYLAVLFFGLLTFLGYGQKNGFNSEKKILLVGHNLQSNCAAKALLILGDTVKIDNCYDDKAKIFSADTFDLVNSEEIYLSILSKNITDWLAIQTELDKITNCDFAVPINLVITEGGKTEIFSLKRFSNCYPPKVRQLMEDIVEYFNKIK